MKVFKELLHLLNNPKFLQYLFQHSELLLLAINVLMKVIVKFPYSCFG
jgi:hypothetical protein